MALVPIKSAELSEILIDLLIKRLELHPAEAKTTVEHLIRSEQFGKSSHGLIRVSYLINSGQFGPFKNQLSTKPTWKARGQLEVDGTRQLGYPLMHELIQMGCDEALKDGFAVAVGSSVYPSGCLGDWADLACQKEVAVILMAGSPPRVAPLGSKSPVVGTNAICVGIPAKPIPLISDCATSEITHGMLLLRQKSGAPLPPRSAIGPDGEPTLNADSVDPVIGRGALLPFGGSHKAFALGMAVELLASLGGNTPGDQDVGSHGVFCLFFGPRLTAKSQNVFSQWLSALDANGTRIPGWFSRRHRQKQKKSGIVHVPEETVKALVPLLSKGALEKIIVDASQPNRRVA